MIGDVLLLAPKHYKASELIFENVRDKLSEKYIITIGGESGSGKSEIAHYLRKLLFQHGIISKILHLDNFYLTSPAERTEWRMKNGVESIGYTEYDWNAINSAISDFKNNKKSTLPFLDIVIQTNDYVTTDFKGVQVLVLEGLYALKADADYKALIDLTYLDTKMAQILRGKEKPDEYRMTVLEREHQVVQELKALADLIIPRSIMIEKTS